MYYYLHLYQSGVTSGSPYKKIENWLLNFYKIPYRTKLSAFMIKTEVTGIQTAFLLTVIRWYTFNEI